MTFTINTINDNGSGMEYSTKEQFLKEIALMIDDCLANGGTFFDVQVDSDASCFLTEEEASVPETATKKEKILTEIQTPFGVIFIEGENPEDREESDRIKIFDSEKRYFEYLYYTGKENYDAILEEIRKMTQITELLAYVGFSAGYQMTSDWTAVSDIFMVDKHHFDSPEAVLENELVNKIGDTYVVWCC